MKATNNSQDTSDIAISGSTLIAKFDGYIKEENGNKFWKNGLWITEPFLGYEKYWDKLMPVIEKICRLKIGDGKEFVEYANLRTFGMLNEETGQIMVRFNGFSLCQSDTLIEAAYLAVLEFVTWWSQADL